MGKGGKGTEASGEGEENMAAWLVAKNTLKIMPIKLPPLEPHDVRVRMKAVGTCGSDVHYLREMRITHLVVNEPMVISHECAGMIEEVGTGVKHLAVGDRVALEPGISCHHCKGGRYNLCDDMRFFTTPLASQPDRPPGRPMFQAPRQHEPGGGRHVRAAERGRARVPLRQRRPGDGRPHHGRRPNRPGQPPRREGLRRAARGHRGRGRAPAVGGGVPGHGRDGEGVDAGGGRGVGGGAHPGGDGHGHRREPGLRRVWQDGVDGAGGNAARRKGVPGGVGPQQDEGAADVGSHSGGGRGGDLPVQGHVAALHRVPALRQGEREAAHHAQVRVLAARRRGGVRGQRADATPSRSCSTSSTLGSSGNRDLEWLESLE